MHLLFKIALPIVLFLSPLFASAQYFDSLQLDVGTAATVASQPYQPLWLVANRYGTITDTQADLSSHIKVRNRHIVGGNRQLYSYLRQSENMPEIGIDYAVDLYVNHQFRSVYLQEAFVNVNINHWNLRYGRFEEFEGSSDPMLSTGSFGISKNALPIPKFSLVVSEYTDIPLTDGFFQFKGKISHGYMEGGYVENALLHDKSLYIRGGRKAFGIYGGFNHHVVWGGRHPLFGQLPSGFDVFWQSVFSQVKDMQNLYELDSTTNLGNHLGFVDFGFDAFIKGYKIVAYSQVPFENGDQIQPFADPNRMLGISIRDTNPNAIITGFTFEYLATEALDERGGVTSYKGYYNNPFYRTGWSYKGNIIGNPLFFDQGRSEDYGLSNNTISNFRNVVNNRVRALHMGVSGQFADYFDFRTLLTVSRNYGNYYNTVDFYPGLMQTYFMQEINYRYDAWQLGATLGADMGQLSNNFGLMLSLEYHFKATSDKDLYPGQY